MMSLPRKVANTSVVHRCIHKSLPWAKFSPYTHMTFLTDLFSYDFPTLLSHVVFSIWPHLIRSICIIVIDCIILCTVIAHMTYTLYLPVMGNYQHGSQTDLLGERSA
jgi:hypothetical protein